MSRGGGAANKRREALPPGLAQPLPHAVLIFRRNVRHQDDLQIS